MTTPCDGDERARELLGETIVGQLSFLGLDGYPRVVPVWFDFRDGQVLISNGPGTYKCRCIRDHGRVRLAGGQARRYLGEERGSRFFSTPPGDGELIRIHPRQIRFTDVSG